MVIVDDGNTQTTHLPPIAQWVASERSDHKRMLPIGEMIEDADPQTVSLQQNGQPLYVRRDTSARRSDRANDYNIKAGKHLLACSSQTSGGRTAEPIAE
jgi:hypothetical protein